MRDDLGTIFLSHSSKDKDVVSAIYERLDASNTFYDIKSIEPGQSFLDAMNRGVNSSSVFVLFHSPNTNGSWVEHEIEIARARHAQGNVHILVVPIKGESHQSLPKWMKQCMTCSEQFKTSDIVRQIFKLYLDSAARHQNWPEIFVGRESLCREIHLAAAKNLQVRGKPLQHIILSGLPGMGRTTISRAVMENTLRTSRGGGPVFDLPDMAEAIDFYLAILQDQNGVMERQQVEKQIEQFNRIDDEAKADAILALVRHWAELNQVITFRTRWGLRDRTRQAKPWLKSFMEKAASVPSIRIIYISERQLPHDAMYFLNNAAQFHVDQLPDSDIQYILGELIDGRHYDAQKAEVLAEHIHGHPATAHFVASLIGAGRSIDTLNENPDIVSSFQDKVVSNIIRSDALSPLQAKILALLGVFPKLSFPVIARVVEAQRKELSEALWDLQESSLVEAVDSEYFRCPGIVAMRSRKELRETSEKLSEEVRSLIATDVESDRIDAQLIDALLISTAQFSGQLPDHLRGLVTASSLLSLVTDRYYRARDMSRGSREVYVSAYQLSKIAIGMESSDDAIEQILFTGGDSAIRAGIYPKDILEKMTEMALPSVYYLIGSYAFHVEKHDEKAAKNLKLSLQMGHFRLRNTRLLARALIRSQDFSGALKVLDELHPAQLERETGLVVQKIRALRGLRLGPEARALEKKLVGRNDEFGEIHIYNASKAIRDLDFDLALQHLEKAEASPKANKFNYQLLRCAVLLEKGDDTLLPFAVETANSVGRRYEALQLQARHAVVSGRWRDAEKLLSKIDKKDFFDYQIEMRMLKQKLEDADVLVDVAAVAEVKSRMEDVIRQSANSPEGYTRA